MKIACPFCHLAGKVNELELPPLGRELVCPRCKGSFQVEKPPPPASNQTLLNSCPSCQYATFTEETFAVCPSCGLSAGDAQLLARKKRDRDQLQRDQASLTRSLRNPDLVLNVPTEELHLEPAGATQPVKVTAWLSIACAMALLCYGSMGLANYYQKDWQAVLSEQVLEPVSRLFVFFSLGFIPWLSTLFSLYFVLRAYRFLKLDRDSRDRLAESAWGGVAVAIAHEAVAFFNWIRVSSSTTSLSYYMVGILSALFMSALLGSPFLLLIRYLRGDVISRACRKAHPLPRAAQHH